MNHTEWKDVDWTLRDVDIAALVGVSKERVRQVRKSLCKGKSQYYKMSGQVIFLRKWLPSIAEIIPTLSCKEITEMCPLTVGYQTVIRVCKELGLTTRLIRPLCEIITKDNLASFVTVTATGCWEWNLYTTGASYATMGRRNGKHLYTRTFVYELFHGKLPRGKLVLSSCKNPKCVNPQHLDAGTPLANARCRSRWLVLTPQDRLKIRKKFDAGQGVQSLAAELNTSMTRIYSILRGMR